MITKLVHIGGGNQTPDRVVIHSMGEFIDDGDKQYHAWDWLVKLRYSAQYLIAPDGEVIKMRREDEVAYHARGFNIGSIGIELLVEGVHNYATFLEAIKTDWATDAQYDSLIELTNGIISTWCIDHDRIDRHSDLSPGRKLDPGEGFKWDYFKSKLL